MDKSWITLDRVSDAYQAGLTTFLDYVEANASVGGIMYCPCRDCINTKRGNRDFVRLHLTRRGWAPGYALMTWTFHGESDLIRSLDNMSDEGDDSEEGGDDIRGILHDTFHIPSPAGQDQDQDRPYDQSLHRPTSRPQFMSGSQSQYMHPDRFRDMCADPFLYRSQHQNFHGPTYPSDTYSPGHARPHVHSQEQPYRPPNQHLDSDETQEPDTTQE